MRNEKGKAKKLRTRQLVNSSTSQPATLPINLLIRLSNYLRIISPDIIIYK